MDKTIRAVVASTSGETGVTFSEALRGLVPVVAVSHEEIPKKRIHKGVIKSPGVTFMLKSRIHWLLFSHYSYRRMCKGFSFKADRTGK